MALSQWACIVDSDTATEVADGRVGEIWLHGLNIGKGYWNKDSETEETFHNLLAHPLPEGSHSAGAPEGAQVDAHRRLRRHLRRRRAVHHRPGQGPGDRRRPQPLPAGPRVQRRRRPAPTCGPGFIAAFAVRANQLPAEVFEGGFSGLTADPDDASEQLVIVAERGPGRKADPQEIADAVRAAIAGRHA